MPLFYGVSTAGAEDIASGTAGELARLIELIIGKIPLWIAAFIVIILSVLVAKIGRSIIESKLAEKGIEEEHKEVQILGGRMTYMGILTIGVTVGLKIAGIDLTTIIAAVAFGIGFALKDMIMNFLAGVMILVGRHFTLGDFINVGGTIGKVVEIQSRVTILQAIDGTKVIVPNAELFRKQVTSFTSNPFRRIEILVGVEYRSDLENVMRVCMKAIKSTKGILIEPKPAVVLDEFGESSINLKLRAWVDSKSGWIKIKSNLILKVKELFNEYGITIPWPIRTIVNDNEQDYSEKILAEPQEAKQSRSEQSRSEQSRSESAEGGRAEALLAQEKTSPQITATAQLAPEKVEIKADSTDDDQPLRPLGEQR